MSPDYAYFRRHKKEDDANRLKRERLADSNQHLPFQGHFISQQVFFFSVRPFAGNHQGGQLRGSHANHLWLVPESIKLSCILRAHKLNYRARLGVWEVSQVGGGSFLPSSSRVTNRNLRKRSLTARVVSRKP